MIDTIETLFSGLENEQLLRSELRRLFEWLKAKGVTAIITGERGEGTLTRYGLEEYVADCVILLDNRVHDQLSTRRLRIVKYRGSAHGTNEYPFIIDEQGITVMPITSSGLAHDASIRAGVERHSRSRRDAGRQRLLQRLQHPGVRHGRQRKVDGGRAFRQFDLRNRVSAASISRWKNRRIRSSATCARSASTWKSGSTKSCCGSARGGQACIGLETHLATMYRDVTDFEPGAVVVDPMSALLGAGVTGDVHSMVLRLVDFLKGPRRHGAVHQSRRRLRARTPRPKSRFPR